MRRLSRMVRLFFVSIFSLCFSGVSLFQPARVFSQDPAQQLVVEGNQALLEGRDLRARDRFTKAIAASPGNPDALLGLKKLHKRVAGYPKSGFAGLWYGLYLEGGAYFFIENEPAKAIGAWEEALRMDPKLPSPAHLEDLKEHLSVSRTFVEAREKERNVARLLEAGLKSIGGRQYQNAIDYLQQAMGLAPERADIASELARTQALLEEQARLEEARQEGARLAAQKEEEEKKRLAREAERRTKKELETKPAPAPASRETAPAPATRAPSTTSKSLADSVKIYKLGLDKYMAGNLEEAIKLFTQAVELDPTNTHAVKALALANLDLAGREKKP